MKDLQSFMQNRRKKTEGFSAHIDDKTVFHIFSRIICEEYGHQGEKNIIPEYYSKNTIFITFKKSIWAQELWLNRQKIIDRVNDSVGNKILYNIKVKH